MKNEKNGNVYDEILQYIIGLMLGTVLSLVVVRYVFFQDNPGSFMDLSSVGQKAFICIVAVVACFLVSAIFAVRSHILSKKLAESRRVSRIFQEKDAVKTKFLAFAAHNLRTPAASFRWSLSEFLKAEYENLTEDQKRSLRSLYSISLTMLSLIEDFLDLSKLELHQLEIVLKAVSLRRFREEAARIISELMPTAEDKKISVDASLGEGDDHAIVYVDITRIVRVVENLVENAINYTLDGGKVSVFLERKADKIEFRVTDNGIGIPEAEQSKIFGEFFRSSNAKIHKSTGSGIGLYLSKKLVEAHRGDLSFTSKEGKGSTFIFSIPTAAKGEQQVEDVFKRL